MLKSRILDKVIISNLIISRERYNIKFKLTELGKELIIPVAPLEFVGEGIYPSLILGREDFFSRTTICFDKNVKLTVKVDDFR